MIKGITILKILEDIDDPEKAKKNKIIQHLIQENDDPIWGWSKVDSYFTTKDEEPSEDTFADLCFKYHREAALDVSNYRQYPYKFYSFPLNSSENPLFLCVYTLDSSESLDIVKISPDEARVALMDKVREGKGLKEYIQQIQNYKNNLLDKLENPKILQTEVGDKANKLIDDGNFEAAQELIKMAKEIPIRIVDAYQRSLQETKNQDFKRALKSLDDVIENAQKIGDHSIQAYIKLRKENTSKIPNYQKDLKNLYGNIVKTLSKGVSIPPYAEQLSNVHQAIDLLDQLELDKQIEKLGELETLIEQASSLSQRLSRIDGQVQNIVQELKK